MTTATASAGSAVHEHHAKTVDERAAALARQYGWVLISLAALALIPFAIAPDKPGPEAWAVYYGLLGLVSGWCGIAWILRTARLYFAHRETLRDDRKGES
jgi:hypothetical protein